MAGSNPIDGLTADPGFSKLAPEAKAQAMRGVLAKTDAGFAKLNSDDQNRVISGIAKKRNIDMPGSVFDKPTVGQEFKRVGKALAPIAAGFQTAVSGAKIGGELAGPYGAIAGAAAGGLAAPFIERGISEAVGNKTNPVTMKQALRSAALNAAFTGLGEGVTALRGGEYAEVAPEIKALPTEAQTAGNIKQAARNRTFLRALGMDDGQIDAALKNPDVEAETARLAKAGDNYKQAFQAVVDEQRKGFTARYDAAYGQFKDTPVNMARIGQQMEDIASGPMQHELSPGFKAYLQRKGLEFTRAGEATGPSVGGVPWKQLPENLRNRIIEQGGAQGIKAPSSDLPLQGVRDFRTELREQLPSNATNLDKKVFNQLTQQVTDSYENAMTEAGAKPEQIAAIRALDQEYGRFQSTIRALDPRSAKYGTDVANLLFDPMVKNPSDAMNFIRMAKAAEVARPGEVMPQLREAFKDKLLNDSMVAAQGRPVEEMRLLQNMQKQWGGEKGTRGVLTEMFGADNPMSDPTKMAAILGKLSAPDQAAAAASNGIMRQAQDLLKSPAFLTRLAVTYGLYRSFAGGTGSPWKDLGKPEVMIPALVGIWFSGKAANFAFGAADRGLQTAYADFVLNPNTTTLSKWMDYAGGAATSVSSLPSQRSSQISK